MVMGPACIDESTDPDFFAAAGKLGINWDGKTYQKAIKTILLDEGNPWLYAMQVNQNLTVACTYHYGFVCKTGQGNVDLSTIPCR